MLLLFKPVKFLMSRRQVRCIIAFFRWLQLIFFQDTLLGTLGQLVESLSGLERILTTPIPFSFVKNELNY
jgi:predicted membrane chloride channel (bestrophin family)